MICFAINYDSLALITFYIFCFTQVPFIYNLIPSNFFCGFKLGYEKNTGNSLIEDWFNQPLLARFLSASVVVCIDDGFFHKQ